MTHDWAERWKDGYGLLERQPDTVAKVEALVERLVRRGGWPDTESIYRVLAAADRLTRAAMWLIVHMSYARKVDLSGAALPAQSFKSDPEGHTGGSLNMAPAFAGYLAANVLSGVTRAWVMGQGHCVAAIEAINVLTGDVSPAQRQRYDRTEAGLSQLVSDFYGYGIRADGTPAAPLGSHAGPQTAGAVSEGGYLGFAELQYVHMPLRGENLVAFLSGGGYRWDVEGWYGGDLNRVVIKTEGEGGRGGGLEFTETQLLFSRAVGRYTDFQVGVRHDVRPRPQTTYATVSVEALLPYWWETEAALFLSEDGDLRGRVEAWYDLRLTQRVVLQTQAEVGFSAQDIRTIEVGSGITHAELGLRLRYEIRREFAPYVGVSYERSLGRTAHFARAAGERPENITFVAGIRSWF